MMNTHDVAALIGVAAPTVRRWAEAACPETSAGHVLRYSDADVARLQLYAELRCRCRLPIDTIRQILAAPVPRENGAALYLVVDGVTGRFRYYRDTKAIIERFVIGSGLHLIEIRKGRNGDANSR